MNFLSKISRFLTFSLVITSLAACSIASPETIAESTITSSGESTENQVSAVSWTEESHSNDSDPDYEVVFPQDAVNRIDITLSGGCLVRPASRNGATIRHFRHRY